MRRPNLVLVVADEHRYDCTGRGGHPLAPTPQLDQLAREGVWFTHAFTPCPICCPARQTLMTSQWPFRHAGLTNYDNGELRAAVSPTTPNYAGGLREAGYAQAHIGKWHVHPTAGPCEFGFDDSVTEADYKAWRAAQGIAEAATAGPLAYAVDPAPAAATRKHWLTDRAIEWVRRQAGGDSPFHLRLDFSEPHFPLVVPESYAGRFDPRAIQPWGSFGETFAGKPWIQRQMLRHWAIEDWTWADWAPFVAMYLASIAHVDEQVGRLRAALRQAGVLENTLFVYTADHGDMMGGHRMFDKHVVLYDDVVRVPLALAWPAGLSARGLAAGGVVERFASNCLDLGPTLLDAAGVAAPMTMQGRSLLRSEPADAPDAVFATLHGSQWGLNTQRMIRTRRWKYIFNATAIDELYDLERDPDELRNLVPAGAYREKLIELRGELLAWGARSGDPLLTNKHLRRSLEQGRVLDEI